MNHYDELYKLVEEAAPIMAVLAYKGGSLFAKQWLDRAKVDFGIETPIPTDAPTAIDLPDDGA